MSQVSSNQPVLEFPQDLPVSQLRDEIAHAIISHQVVIVAGETGSGKTTQLPKIALSIGRKSIAHTQPRRIAARTIAERIAEETGTQLGDLVGYQVRFTDRVSEHTRVRLMTDGILLNAIHRDRELRAYDTIIIDEAHERSLNIDFLLGYLKTLLPQRPDLKIIVTSATIDPESFAKHFADPTTGESAPIIEVSGRTYPVDVRYRPLVEERPAHESDAAATERKSGVEQSEVVIERDLFDAIGDGVQELFREAPGDILVFLSGEAEIRDAADALQGRFGGQPARPVEILPLYGRLSAAEQHRVFESRRTAARRIVLATNVAETSLTVPGIRYVIDAGTARISRYSARSKVQRLPIEPISQASARQRSGRSGRTSPGIAIRLYSEEDFEARPAFTEPEVLRTGLASVILQMLALNLGEIAEFPFLTPPDRRDIADGHTLLAELGATSGQGRSLRITPTGRQLSRLPLEPRFARMVLEARNRGVSAEVIAIVAGLTVQDVRERPAEARGRADELHARFADPLGDLMTLLNLWNYLQEQQQALSSSAFRRLCKAEFINFLRVREWMDLVRQITRAERDLAQRARKRARSAEQQEQQAQPTQKQTQARGARGEHAAQNALAEAIHRSVLAGLLSRIGMRDDRQDRRPAAGARPGRRQLAQEYIGSRGTRFALHPASVLAKRSPEVVMTVELVETSRLFARSNAVINPEWAEELAGPLAKSQLSEPRWEKSQGAAVAYERVTLYGVPIVQRRRVQLSRFDAELARELFIQHALVQGEWNSPHAFDRANHQLRRELQQLEERSRRRDIAHGDEAVFAFYDERIPPEVVNVRSFEGWWKQASRETPKLLNMRREDLLAAENAEVDEREFPREWRHDDQRLRLRYRFDPSAEDDGITVAVPLPLLPRISESEFEKLVPGMREELVAALIRTLPKPIRKHVVPAGDWAKILLREVEKDIDHAPLTELLASEIRRRVSAPVTAEDFDTARLPAHLTPTFTVLDERGRTIASGKDLEALKHRHKDRVTQGVAQVAQAALPKSDLERSGLTEWNFGDLPRHIDTAYASGAGGRGGRGTRGAGTVRAYPALRDRRTSVDLVLVADAHEQARLSRRGIRRLLLLSTPSPASYIRDHLSNDEKLLLGGGPHRTLDDAIADVSLAIADRLIQRHHADGLVWHERDFQVLANEYARALIDEIYEGIALTARVLQAGREARKAIESAQSLAVLSQVSDAKAQLDSLIWAAPQANGEGFVARTGLRQLERVPVYCEAIRHRMQQLTTNTGRDRTWQNEIEQALALYTEAGGSLPLPPDAPAHIVRARWLIEELRISLFAQQLRAAETVSLTRIRKVLQDDSTR